MIYFCPRLLGRSSNDNYLQMYGFVKNIPQHTPTVHQKKKTLNFEHEKLPLAQSFQSNLSLNCFTAEISMHFNIFSNCEAFG